MNISEKATEVRRRFVAAGSVTNISLRLESKINALYLGVSALLAEADRAHTEVLPEPARIVPRGVKGERVRILLDEFPGLSASEIADLAECSVERVYELRGGSK